MYGCKWRMRRIIKAAPALLLAASFVFACFGCGRTDETAGGGSLPCAKEVPSVGGAEGL